MFVSVRFATWRFACMDVLPFIARQTSPSTKRPDPGSQRESAKGRGLKRKRTQRRGDPETRRHERHGGSNALAASLRLPLSGSLSLVSQIKLVDRVHPFGRVFIEALGRPINDFLHRGHRRATSRTLRPEKVHSQRSRPYAFAPHRHLLSLAARRRTTGGFRRAAKRSASPPAQPARNRKPRRAGPPPNRGP